MLGAAFNETYLMAAVNAALLALTMVLPALLVGYARQATRRMSADFSLRRLEAFELDRAEAQYRKISQRMAEIDRIAKSGTGSFWKRLRHRAEIMQQYRAELEDLRANARHLRASIILFRRRPIRRLRSWVHMISSRFALRQFAGVLPDAPRARDRLHLLLGAAAVGEGPHHHARNRHPLEAVRRAPAVRQRHHVTRSCWRWRRFSTQRGG